MNLLKYTLLAIIGFNCLVLKSQTHNDSVTADITKVIQEKNLRFSILGGPGYTPDYGFLIGGAALFTFSMDQQDKNLQRSVMPISFGITFAKPLGFNAMLKPQLFFKKDKIRLLGTYYFKNTNDNYFGIDYDHHKYEIERGDKSIYTSNVIQLNPIVMFRIKETDFFVGPMLDYSHEVVKNPGEAVYYDKLFREQGGDENGLTINSFGVGVTGSYDNRDVVANACKGV